MLAFIQFLSPQRTQTTDSILLSYLDPSCWWALTALPASANSPLSLCPCDALGLPACLEAFPQANCRPTSSCWAFDRTASSSFQVAIPESLSPKVIQKWTLSLHSCRSVSWWLLLLISQYFPKWKHSKQTEVTSTGKNPNREGAPWCDRCTLIGHSEALHFLPVHLQQTETSTELFKGKVTIR